MKPCKFAFALPLFGLQLWRASLERAGQVQDICTGTPRLWSEHGTPMIDLGEAGVIIGVLFSKISAARLKSLPSVAPVGGDFQLLAAWLVRECWGAYVAVLADRATESVAVLVDPSGLLPVYRTKTDTHLIVVSHPRFIEQTCGKRPQPSWTELRTHLERPDLRLRNTCLENVHEYSPGEITRLSEPHIPGKPVWRPDRFMPVNTAISCGQVAHELKDISTSVIGAWAGFLGPTAVAASGGVDSSLICAALSAANQPFDCVTLSTSDPSGDESAYVRRLAAHLGVRTIARVYDVASIDPLHCVSSELARPSRKSFMAALDAELFGAAQSLGASVIFDGNGGDNLFCFLHNAAPVVDRLYCNGPGRGLASAFIDMCRLTGCDLPTMTRAALRRAIHRFGPGLWAPDLRLLAPSHNEFTSGDPVTPWFDVEVGRHGGKRDHLALIMRNQNHVNGIAAEGLPRFSPLLSQPLVEYCLSVPTWVWCTDGINRAPARAAFAADLPREIVMRTSKAGPDSFLREFFAAHRAVYRELLLDGLLARHELIDSKAIEKAINVDIRSEGSIIYRLLDLAEAENWARSWQN